MGIPSVIKIAMVEKHHCISNKEAYFEQGVLVDDGAKIKHWFSYGIV